MEWSIKVESNVFQSIVSNMSTSGASRKTWSGPYRRMGGRLEVEDSARRLNRFSSSEAQITDRKGSSSAFATDGARVSWIVGVGLNRKEGDDEIETRGSRVDIDGILESIGARSWPKLQFAAGARRRWWKMKAGITCNSCCGEVQTLRKRGKVDVEMGDDKNVGRDAHAVPRALDHGCENPAAWTGWQDFKLFGFPAFTPFVKAQFQQQGIAGQANPLRELRQN
ncbi:hypothetical protein GALMADRAFT_214035 [Galerina marginata CBS 339.88]|uniref:Uncharacterized protein n=1 Tax=Galerina marginata (strain CBS 339.88) TaxID=685588 RepID=A0A067SW76_GALM3|nr:hypothetical protein GALMADRAFT_214035 [Galerina marginata CBS 339.88]